MKTTPIQETRTTDGRMLLDTGQEHKVLASAKKEMTAISSPSSGTAAQTQDKPEMSVLTTL